MKPIPELPAKAVRLGDGLVHEALEVVDASPGGLALATTGSLEHAKSGERMAIRLTLASFGEHVVEVEVRWVAAGLTGVELREPSADASQAIRRYVAELLERGAPS